MPFLLVEFVIQKVKLVTVVNNVWFIIKQI